MNSSQVHRLALSPATGQWFRAIPPVYWSRVTNTRYTRRTYGRFSPGKDGDPQFETISFGESADVTALECSLVFFDRRSNHSYPNPDAPTHLIVAADVVLQQVADLTTADSLAVLETNVQELTGDWAVYNGVRHRRHLMQLADIAPTQELGQQLFNAPGIEGFRVFSARKPECLCLVVFPQKLFTGSSLTFFNAPDAPKASRGKR